MASDKTLQEQQPKDKRTSFYSDVFVTAQTSGTIDPLEGIRIMLASVDIGVSKEDAIAPATMHHWQRITDGIINSKLSAVYQTPLIRITRENQNLDINGNPVSFYPYPIQKIAISIVCYYIVINEFQDVDPNVNEAAQTWEIEAMNELEQLAGYDGQVGMMALEGQQRRARTPFANPNVMPRPLPRSGKTL